MNPNKKAKTTANSNPSNSKKKGAVAAPANAAMVANAPAQNAGAPAPAPTQKKRKRKANPDPTARKGKIDSRKKKKKELTDAQKQGVINMRGDGRQILKRKSPKSNKIKEQKYRATVMLNEEEIEANYHGQDKQHLLPNLKSNLIPKLEEIPSFRRVTKILEWDEETGSPMKVEVETPAKPTTAQKDINDKIQEPESPNYKDQYQLIRVWKDKQMSIFESADAGRIPIDQIKKPKSITDKAFFNSQQYKNIKKAYKNIKFVSVDITPQLLAKTNKEIAENQGKRQGSQNKQMVEDGVKEKEGSATAYARATNLFHDTLQWEWLDIPTPPIHILLPTQPINTIKLFDDKVKWEWLHLIAHMILAKLSQNVDNLVAGTNHANTEMIFADIDIPYLSKMYPDGFRLEIWADLLQDPQGKETTQLANMIFYKITTKDFTRTIPFYAQNPNKPHIHFGSFLHVFLTSLVETAKAAEQAARTAQTNQNNNNAGAPQNNPPSTPFVNNHPHLGYRKKLKPQSLFQQPQTAHQNSNNNNVNLNVASTNTTDHSKKRKFDSPTGPNASSDANNTSYVSYMMNQLTGMFGLFSSKDSNGLTSNTNNNTISNTSIANNANTVSTNTIDNSKKRKLDSPTSPNASSNDVNYGITSFMMNQITGIFGVFANKLGFGSQTQSAKNKSVPRSPKKLGP